MKFKVEVGCFSIGEGECNRDEEISKLINDKLNELNIDATSIINIAHSARYARTRVFYRKTLPQKKYIYKY